MSTFANKLVGIALSAGVASILCTDIVSAQSREELAAGRRTYRTYCAVCHSPKGEGAPLGKSLIDRQSRSYTEADLMKIIYDGRVDLGMAKFGGALSNSEIQQVTWYVRELQGRSPKTAAQRAADASERPAHSAETIEKGEALFTGKAGCIQCHSYAFRGGFHGPDLNEVSRRLTSDEIREAVLTPSATIIEGYGSREVVTKGGETLKARSRNETDATLQLLNDEGTIWTTYFKKDLRSIQDFSGSYMPENAFTRLSSQEQAALLAFLEDLK